MSDMPITIFISYPRIDMKFVDQLEEDLRVRGFGTWVDRRKLEGGRNWLNDIQQAIEQSQILLVALSPDAVNSEYVLMEYRYAARMGKLVIPIQYRPCPKVPMDINNIQWIDFTQLYNKGLNDLLAVLAHIEKTSFKTQRTTPLPAQPLVASKEDEANLVAPQPAPPPPEPNSDELYLEGLKARSDGDLERAVAIWQQMFDRDPNYKEGTFASQREKLLEKLHPQRIARLRDIAEEASKAGEWGREISAWEALLSLETNDEQAQRRLALAKKHRKYAWHYENALQFVQREQPSLAKTELEMLWDEVPYYGDPANLAQQLKMYYRLTPKSYDVEIEERSRQREREMKIKTVEGFVEFKLKTDLFSIWIAIFSLLAGAGSGAGMLTHSPGWSIGTVGAMTILAYPLGYRRAIHLLIMVGIALISGIIAFGVAEYGSTFATAQQLDNVMFVGRVLFWDGKQLNSGLIIGIISSIFLVSFIYRIYFDSSLDDNFFNSGLAFGGLGGIILALIIWLIAALVSMSNGWGFGFGPGWYIALIGLVVGVASGVGLSAWFIVCLIAFD